MAFVDKRKLNSVIKHLERQYGRPHIKPRTEPLDSLVATILSQSTSDVNSGRAYDSLRRAFPTWRQVAAARAASVARAIKSGGLARQKAARIVKLLRLVEKERGRLSLRFLHRMNTMEAVRWLVSFQGVGLKTACVVLAFACGRDIFPVDTHVERVSGRLGLVPAGTNAARVHYMLDPAIPGGGKLSLHLNLIRLGRELCKAQRPLCGSCFMRSVCDCFKRVKRLSAIV